MSIPGVDYAWAKPTIAALKAAGEVFVMQYFSPDGTKNLTPTRAHQLQDAGIEFGVVWEFTANAMRGGRPQGEHDAQQFEAQAKACGIDGIPGYFACDFDATPEDQPKINAYLDGAAAVLGDDRGRNFYGGFWPASRARAAGKTRRIWGTRAWSGTNWATASWRPDILQGGFVRIGGVTCDLDAALSTDFGQWPRPTAVRHWGAWETKGHTSLAQVATACGWDGTSWRMSPAHILRVTAIHFGQFDPVVAAYENALHTGAITAAEVIPAGGKLWVLR